MIVGRFGDTSGRPYIEGRLIIASQSAATNVSFLMDTGADQSVLAPSDAIKMGVDYTKLLNVIQSSGIGGNSDDFVEPANFVFVGTSGRLYMFQATVIIMKPRNDNKDMPSLLGRNIIDRMRITYSPMERTLQANVLSADHVFGPFSQAAGT